MARTDFFKTWEVVRVDNMTDVSVKAIFVIKDVQGASDKVNIQYPSGFSGYPACQEGSYDSATDRVSAQFTTSTSIRLGFPGGSTPNYDRLVAFVQETAAGTIGPEVGEFEAEACSAGVSK